MKAKKTALHIISLLIFLFSTCYAAAEKEDDYTETQILLLGTPHLKNLGNKETKLHYRLTRNGSKPFKGSAVGDIGERAADGGRDASYTFTYDDNKKTFPKVLGFRSNPLIMFFLEWDLDETLKTTTNKHSKTALRNKARLAMWKNADVADIFITHNKKTYPAKRIKLAPYLDNNRDDPVKTRRYEFILSEAIPGGFQSLSSHYDTDGEKITTLVIYDHAEEPK